MNKIKTFLVREKHFIVALFILLFLSMFTYVQNKLSQTQTSLNLEQINVINSRFEDVKYDKTLYNLGVFYDKTIDRQLFRKYHSDNGSWYLFIGYNLSDKNKIKSPRFSSVQQNKFDNYFDIKLDGNRKQQMSVLLGKFVNTVTYFWFQYADQVFADQVSFRTFKMKRKITGQRGSAVVVAISFPQGMAGNDKLKKDINVFIKKLMPALLEVVS